MTTKRKAIKKSRPQIVGVIASAVDLRSATTIHPAPDLFELRLDLLHGVLNLVERKISLLPAPIIITARHPREGGANNLSPDERQHLLLRFLTCAKYIDVELQSVSAFRKVLAVAKENKVRLIISVHDFTDTPSARLLSAKFRRARTLDADVFKIASCTDSPPQLARLVNFVSRPRPGPQISAMGIGKLGGLSRLLLAQSGSVLNYAALGEPRIEGQLSLDILRSAMLH